VPRRRLDSDALAGRLESCAVHGAAFASATEDSATYSPHLAPSRVVSLRCILRHIMFSRRAASTLPSFAAAVAHRHSSLVPETSPLMRTIVGVRAIAWRPPTGELGQPGVYMSTSCSSRR